MKLENKGILFICATPIGNLEDITIRVLNCLRQVKIIACEDTRRTLKLLNNYSIKPARLISYHQHSPPERINEIINFLKEGEDVALVADAGMPGLSDPGAKLVSRVWQEDLRVTVLPGPSVLTAALAISGYQTDQFAFLGFLNRIPHKQRQKVLRKNSEHVMVLFESPHQIKKTLRELEELLGDREIIVIRELTKKFEEVTRGTPSEQISYFSEKELRGEFTLVINASSKLHEDVPSKESLKIDLQELIHAGLPPKYAVKAVSLLRKVPRNEVYDIHLMLKGKLNEE